MAWRQLRTCVFLVTVLNTSYAAAQPDAATATEHVIAGGFRMEGDPKIETVFGDTAQYKRYVARFFLLHPEMQKVHDDFARNVQSVIASLAADLSSGVQKKCPTDAVALAYTRAFRQGQVFHKLGKELEVQYTSIKELDALGETRSLTPDYRWKVTQALKLYDGVLVDFREMKVQFQDQLTSELAFHHCDAQTMVTRGEEFEKTGAPPPEASIVPRRPGKKGDAKKPEAPLVAASTITFFVDNSSCPTAVRVVLDGTLLGEVGSAAKAAFRVLVGRHEFCLIPQTSSQRCGDQGTLRKTYIHDGWSIAMRCV